MRRSSKAKGSRLEKIVAGEVARRGYLVDTARSLRSRLPDGSYRNIKEDFFGYFDILAISPGGILAIQVGPVTQAAKKRRHVDRFFEILTYDNGVESPAWITGVVVTEDGRKGGSGDLRAWARMIDGVWLESTLEEIAKEVGS